MTKQAWLREGEIIVKEDIFNDRIPKQKVKEAINKVFPTNDEEDNVHRKLLLKELGLKE